LAGAPAKHEVVKYIAVERGVAKQLAAEHGVANIESAKDGAASMGQQTSSGEACH
jgi:hypothetical protein